MVDILEPESLYPEAAGGGNYIYSNGRGVGLGCGVPGFGGVYLYEPIRAPKDRFSSHAARTAQGVLG